MNGIVHVSAKDLATGREQRIRIESSSGLNKEEIQRMVREAELHAADDKTTRKEIEIRNNADALLYATEKMLRDDAAKIGAADKKAVEDTSAELRRALDQGNTTDIESASEKLTQATHRLAEAMYAATSAQQHTASGGPGPEYVDPNDNSGPNEAGSEAGDAAPIDADFAFVDDEKNT